MTTPIPSATLLIVRDDPFEVLMVRRSARGPFPSALVFPGGAVEEQDGAASWLSLTAGGAGLSADARALRIAAVRETWEEVGLLVAGTSGPAGASTAASGSFSSLVAARSGVLDLDAVHHFGNWVTPAVFKRRWDTHFFLVAADRDAEPVVDGHETVAHEWVSPTRLVEDALSGVRPLLFPTLANVVRLAESSSVADAVAATSVHPVVPIHAQHEDQGERQRIWIPEGLGYSLTEWIVPGADVGGP